MEAIFAVMCNCANMLAVYPFPNFCLLWGGMEEGVVLFPTTSYTGVMLIMKLSAPVVRKTRAIGLVSVSVFSLLVFPPKLFS